MYSQVAGTALKCSFARIRAANTLKCQKRKRGTGLTQTCLGSGQSLRHPHDFRVTGSGQQGYRAEAEQHPGSSLSQSHTSPYHSKVISQSPNLPTTLRVQSKHTSVIQAVWPPLPSRFTPSEEPPAPQGQQPSLKCLLPFNPALPITERPLPSFPSPLPASTLGLSLDVTLSGGFLIPPASQAGRTAVCLL